jgi:hypothetical protein
MPITIAANKLSEELVSLFYIILSYAISSGHVGHVGNSIWNNIDIQNMEWQGKSKSGSYILPFNFCT